VNKPASQDLTPDRPDRRETGGDGVGFAKNAEKLAI
jgi:hypothetical protein